MRSTDEQALARALRDRADHVDPAPGPRPDDVIGLAVGIRRRRRLTALAAVAAAAVIAIPTALGATGVLGRDAAPQPITEVPDSSSVFDLSGLPTGDEPLFSIINSSTELDGVECSVWAAPRNEPADTVEVCWDLNLVVLAVDATATVTSDNREVFVASPNDGTLRLGTIDRPGDYRPVAIADGCTRDDCRVFLEDENKEQVVMTVDGSLEDIPPEFERVTTTGPGVIGGYVSIGDDTACSELRDDDGVVFETCDWTLGEFSPDGRYLIGLPAFRSGLGDTELALLDARTGLPVAAWRAAEGSAMYVEQTWENNNEHVLVVAWQDDAWSIVRAGIDGSLEFATEPMGEEYFGFRPEPTDHRVTLRQ